VLRCTQLAALPNPYHTPPPVYPQALFNKVVSSLDQSLITLDIDSPLVPRCTQLAALSNPESDPAFSVLLEAARTVLTARGRMQGRAQGLVHTGGSGVHAGGSGVHTGGSGVHTGDSGVHTGGSDLHTGGSGVHTGGSGVHTGGSGVHTGGSGLHTGDSSVHTGGSHTGASGVHSPVDVNSTARDLVAEGEARLAIHRTWGDINSSQTVDIDADSEAQLDALLLAEATEAKETNTGGGHWGDTAGDDTVGGQRNDTGGGHCDWDDTGGGHRAEPAGDDGASHTVGGHSDDTARGHSHTARGHSHTAGGHSHTARGLSDDTARGHSWRVVRRIAAARRASLLSLRATSLFAASRGEFDMCLYTHKYKYIYVGIQIYRYSYIYAYIYIHRELALSARRVIVCGFTG